ncbi:nuclear transport factor 2 family protein [Paenibacillus bovis]|uniref:DUF4440 domain-containing protein n=1 Tax=Paenibacillus bovis TaxID=1616788 RepID=A0A172ZGS6_9BACL|nr:nuclear transport factor 2 family protein [Paenibacillus bovis]ANF96713.1 DUF4440 domain-containing protein [Paenibacillus bovis]
MNKELVVSYEERLRKAMMQGDVDGLDQLIDHQLVFVNHFGQALSKQDDLEAHRSGIVNFSNITFLEQRIILLQDSAVTVTRAALAGMAAGNPIDEEMYYTRVWQMNNDELKVVSGHCSLVQ